MPPTSIHELLAPLSWSSFLGECWGRRHVHIAGTDAKLGGLASWSELNAALASHRFPASRLQVGYHQRTDVIDARVDRRGHAVPHLNLPRLYEQLGAGKSLVLFQVDEIFQHVKLLAEGLGRHFGAHVAINLFASGTPTQSFGTHRDDEDQLIIQVSGRKRWQLFGESRELPSQAIDDVVLAPGDVLYVPREHWHDVTSVGEASLHLTCQIDAPTGAQFLRWFAEELCSDETFRMDLPRFGGPADRREHIRRLRQLVIDRFDDHQLGRYLQHHTANLEPRLRLSLPHAVIGDGLPAGDDFVVTSNAPAALELRREADEVVFATHGREWRLDASFAGLVRRVLAEGPWRFSELRAASADVSGEDVRALVGEFLASGLVFVAQGDA